LLPCSFPQGLLTHLRQDDGHTVAQHTLTCSVDRLYAIFDTDINGLLGKIDFAVVGRLDKRPSSEGAIFLLLASFDDVATDGPIDIYLRLFPLDINKNSSKFALILNPLFIMLILDKKAKKGS
jgi:hypothetical protein